MRRMWRTPAVSSPRIEPSCTGRSRSRGWIRLRIPAETAKTEASNTATAPPPQEQAERDPHRHEIVHDHDATPGEAVDERAGERGDDSRHGVDEEDRTRRAVRVREVFHTDPGHEGGCELTA